MYSKKTVYALKHNQTGRIYVGRTVDLMKRIDNHFHQLRHGKHHVELMQSDFNNLGGDYIVYALDSINEFGEEKKEFEWMEKLKTYDKQFGYNYQDPHFAKTRKKKMKFHRIKEIATAIQDVAFATGYSYEFLSSVFMEAIKDGETAEDAFTSLRNVAFEHDI